ncbi:MAG: endonuclease [Eubacteriaceae bacterium]|jgi:endonuclease/exonuclease/phosphatase family metal-dependent hydrolase|nr:endonuclease [Eubacteriaceae bacterium]
MARKTFRVILLILAAVIIAAAMLLLYLTVTEYRPADTEDAAVLSSAGTSSVRAGSDVSLLSWNIGYAGLGAGSDFFMDGGKGVADADRATVKKYLKGIENTAFSGKNKADITMFQEVDIDSSRSYDIDESKTLKRGSSMFALNFSVRFIPYPLPPIGKVNAGLMVDSEYPVKSAKRISLPCPFKWPVRLANLKRCLLVNYIPIKDSDKYLVVVDLHLEAYDNGSGKAAQTRVLKKFLLQEYKKGNYVIAGGDFNQEFPGVTDVYPNTHLDLWKVGMLEQSSIPDGFSFAYDTSTPSCRLDNQPYDAADKKNTQYYVIDGFILSPNVRLKTIRTQDEGFVNSDHNPVRMTVTLVK